MRLGALGLGLIFVAWLMAVGVVSLDAYWGVSAFSNPRIEKLQQTLTEDALENARGDLRRVRHFLFPVLLPGKTLGWMPWLGRELRAPEDILRRAEADVEAAQILLGGIRDAGSDLDELRTAIESDGLSTAPASMRKAADALDGPAADAQAIVSSHLEIDYWFFVSDRIQKRVDKVEALLLPAASTMDAASAFLRDSADVLEYGFDLVATSDDPVPTVPPEVAMERLPGSLAKSFESLGTTTTELGTLTESFGQSSGVIQSIEEFLGLAGRFADAGTVTAERLDQFLNCESGLLQPECEIGQLLASMEGTDGTLGIAHAAVEQLSTTLVPQLTKVGAPGAEVLSELASRLRRPVQQANDSVIATYALLGGSSHSDVLILGVSPDELRPAGGFVSSAWTATFEHGALETVTYFDVVEFDKRVAPEAIDPAPPSLRREMNAGGLYMRDVTWFAGVPTVGQRALEIADEAGYGSHDHVMVMTLWFVTKLTDGLGGVVVNGELVNGDQILDVIETGTDAGGRAFLAELMPALLDRLSGPSLRENPSTLISVLHSLIKEKDAVFYSSDPDAQTALEELGWGGVIPTATTDRLAIFDSNIGWNKSDRHVVREFDYRVSLKPGGSSSAKLGLTYSMPDLDHYICTAQTTVLTAVPYEELTARCNWNFVRGYIAYGSRIISHEPVAALVDSMAVRNGTIEEGDDTFRSDFDENGSFFAAVVRTKPGEPSHVELEYELPTYIIKELAGGRYVYSLRLVAQPGARGRNGVVTVELPKTAKAISAGDGDVSGNVVTFDTDLTVDTNLTVAFGLN